MNYEHCLPMNAERENAKRSVVIFRHGNTLPVSLDTGTPLVNDFVDAKIAKEMEVATQISSAQSSPLNANIKEGKKLYSKDKLVAIGAHRLVIFIKMQYTMFCNDCFLTCIFFIQ